jgi:UDP-4-amino-4,6-dideoxy-N-acetyl-beta-L-altrosamine transaminase
MFQFIPYGRQSIDEEDINSVVSVLKSDWLTTGPKVPEFEEQIAHYVGSRYAVAVNSGTSALDIAVQALNLPKGSEVITTAFTFAATSNAILYHNLIPVFADIEQESRNIDPNQIRRNITSKTKAILFVDYAGQPCRIAEIKEIADEYDLRLIEDACHAFGASYKGKKIGTFADMTVFSFHPVKPITTGEGGAVVTDNEWYAKRLRLLRSHGIDKESPDRGGLNTGWAYDMVELCRNYRMTDIQAALGISQIKKIDSFITKRNELARLYTEMLGNIPFIEIPSKIEDIVHGWHLYTILLRNMDRNRFFSYMKKNKIGVNVHYIPIYRFSYYQKNLPTNPNNFLVTEDVFKRIITLPLYPALTEQELDYVVETIKSANNK